METKSRRKTKHDLNAVSKVNMPISLSSLNQKRIQDIIIGAVALSIFALILVNRSPNFLRPLSMQIRFGFTWIVPVLFIALFLTLRIPGWQGQLISLSAILSLFSLALAGVWASGHTQSTILSGLIPLFDAQSYYVDAQSLLAGGRFSEFSTARPLFAGFLALLLGITNRNLMETIAILTAINGFTCYLATKEIQRTHGNFPAAFLAVFLFLYFRHRTVGTVMSENLGLPLGILGTLLIWRGITGKSQSLVLFGLFIDTLALNTRPGPFFVLPFILLWGAWYFRNTGKWFSGNFFILGLVIMVAGFGVNLGLVRVLGTPNGVPFSQFSMAFYGLASGGNSFAYVFQAHPELAELTNPDKTREIYKLAFELIRTNPSLIFQGALRNWTLFLSSSVYGMFSYFSGENQYVNLAAYWGVCLLCVLGVIKWVQDISNPYSSFIFVTTTGVFLSVPFVPPADAYGIRLYAAAIIIIGIVPALGLAFALEKIKINFITSPVTDSTSTQAIIWLSTGLVFLIVTGPFMVKGTDHAFPSTPTACQPDEDSIIVQFDPGSFIQVIGMKEAMLDWMPVFHIGLFKRNAHSLPDAALAERLEIIEIPATLFYALDYKSNSPALVIAQTASLPMPGATVEICGQWEKELVFKNYFLFTSKHVIP